MNKQQKTLKVISKDEYSKILAELNDKPCLRLIVNIACQTGLRIGEIQGLTWDNVSFDNKSIQVKLHMHDKGTSSSYMSLPKTAASIRTVYIGDGLLKELKDWKRIQTENRMELGQAYQIAYMSLTDKAIKYLPAKEAALEGYVKLDLVCTTPDGLAISTDHLQQCLSKFNCSIHSLRNTYASNQLAAETRIDEITARMGLVAE